MSISSSLTAASRSLFTLLHSSSPVPRRRLPNDSITLRAHFYRSNLSTTPISLAASSQTQTGSVPSSNFRQRLSQSIIGTKQLNVDETDSARRSSSTHAERRKKGSKRQ